MHVTDDVRGIERDRDHVDGGNASAKTTIELTTKFYQEQQQIHGGKMDMFVGVSNVRTTSGSSSSI